MNVLQISIRIDAVFRSELESSYTYNFPILEDLYDNYLTELKAKMDAKRESMKKYDVEIKHRKIEML